MGDAVRITSQSGRVRVIGEGRADVTADGALIAGDEGQREVQSRSKKIEVRVPTGTDLVVGTSSADVELRGDLGHVGITTVSGDITVERVASIDARTKSGRVEVQGSPGAVRVKTGSSSIHVDHAAGEVRVASVSGKVMINDAQALASVRTVSGTIELGLSAAGGALVETVSGTVRITVPAGVRPAARLKTVSGKRRVECDAGDDVDITARSVSGDLLVTAQP
jgi:DUF4097 and DUF4098 domain-containing protein YvlB